MYYTNDKIYETSDFRKIISQNKLDLIEKYNHFVDTVEIGESYNRLSKIHSIHKYIVEHWQSLLTLGRDVLIDEALPLKKKFLKKLEKIYWNKTRTFWYKNILADACTDYVWNTIIHTGDHTMINPNFNFTYHATNIALSLAEDVIDEGRRIYVDNWYSSAELLDKLGKRSTGAIGTVRKDRKALPKNVVHAKLNKGERKTAYSPRCNATCMQWKINVMFACFRLVFPM